MEDLTPDTWAGKAGLIDQEPNIQYLASLYWAFETLTTVGYGDFQPGTKLERVIYTFWPLVCIIVDSFLIANIITIVSKFDIRADNFEVSFIVSRIMECNLI